MPGANNWGRLYLDEIDRAEQYHKAADLAFENRQPDKVAMFLRMERRHLHNAIVFINNMEAQLASSR